MTTREGISVSVFILCYLVKLSHQQTPPVIGNYPLTVNLKEGRKNMLPALACFPCTATAPGKNVAVSLVSVVPAFAPTNSFAVYKLGTNPEYCLYFLPSQTSPVFSNTPTITLGVNCRDDQIPPQTSNVSFIAVNVVTNEAPIFTTPSVDNCISTLSLKSLGANAVLHRVSASDPDGDPLYFTMTSSPKSDFFKIGETDGVIRSTKPLRSECRTDFSFSITVTDKKNGIVGPIVVNCKFIDPEVCPVITNINRERTINEHFRPPTQIVELITTPNSISVQYDFSTFPQSAFSLFQIVGNRLQLASPLNYEDINHRVINITFQPSNGYCQPKTFYLLLRVTDENDNPVISPKMVGYIVNETSISVSPSFRTEDDDVNDNRDSLSYSIVKGNDNNYFSIDSKTGTITAANYDVDQNAMPSTATLLVQVADSKGGIDNSTVKLTIRDINDNPPELPLTPYTYTVMDCDPINKQLGVIPLPTDKDSAYNNNNQVSFVAASNGGLTVNEDGSVYYSSLLTAGQSSTVSVRARDYGLYPTFLTSSTAISVTVSVVPCTTTQPPTTPVPKNTNVSNTNNVNVNNNNNINNQLSSSNSFFGVNSFPVVNGTASQNSGGSSSGNVAWPIIAGILGALFLGLLGFMLFKYCASGLYNKCCGQKKVEPVEAKEAHKKVEKIEVKEHTERQVAPYRNYWAYQGTSLEYEPAGQVVSQQPYATTQALTTSPRLMAYGY